MIAEQALRIELAAFYGAERLKREVLSPSHPASLNCIRAALHVTLTHYYGGSFLSSGYARQQAVWTIREALRARKAPEAAVAIGLEVYLATVGLNSALRDAGAYGPMPEVGS